MDKVQYLTSLHAELVDKSLDHLLEMAETLDIPKPEPLPKKSNPSVYVPDVVDFPPPPAASQPTTIDTRISAQAAPFVPVSYASKAKSANSAQSPAQPLPYHSAPRTNVRKDHDEKWQYEKLKQRIVKSIQAEEKLLIVMRGVPGSGKSTLARKLVTDFSGKIFSTDEYFERNGSYQFDPSQLPAAHEWNKNRAKQAMEGGVSPIYIDNTNVEAWEMEPYAQNGKRLGYRIMLVEPFTRWKYSAGQCAKKCSHNISEAKIADMLFRFDRNVTVGQLLHRYRPRPAANSQRPSLQAIGKDLCATKGENDTTKQQVNLDELRSLSSCAESDMSSVSMPPVEVGGGLEESWEVVHDEFVFASPRKSSTTSSAASKSKPDAKAGESLSGEQAERDAKVAGRAFVVGRDWRMPAYPGGPAKLDTRVQNQTITVRNSCTQTCCADFAVLELQQSNNAMDDKFLDIELGVDEVNVNDNEEVTCVRDLNVLRLDKGVTAQEVDGGTMDDAIKQLKQQFPKAQDFHFDEVLKACFGNVQWAANLLKDFQDEHFESDFSCIEETSREGSPTESVEQAGPSKPEPKPEPFVLNLTPEFTAQLESEFGAFESDVKPETVTLSHGVARLIHHLIKKSLSSSQEDQDLSLAEQLSLLDMESTLRSSTQRDTAEERAPSEERLARPRSKLEELMDLEAALCKSQQERDAQSTNNKELMATKMKRDLLFKTYPGLAPEVLEDEFAKHKYDDRGALCIFLTILSPYRILVTT